MASDPTDESGGDGDPDRTPPTPRDANKVTPLHPPHDTVGDIAGDTVGVAPGADALADEDLIEMLEELNEKLDSATSVLGEAHAMSAEIPPPPPHDAPVPEPDLSIPAEPPPGKKPVLSLIAAGLGLGLGAIAVIALWPVWTDPAPPPDVPAPKKEARLRETVVQKRAEPSDAAEPEARSSAAAEQPTATLVKPELPVPPPLRRPAAPVPERPAEPPLTVPEEATLLERGRALMAAGDVASARLVYRHGTRRGSVAATLALARTYDPRFLKRSGVIGVPAEPRKALHWYREAARRGSAEAAKRANELEQQVAR